jgi:hypothetical protein
VPPVARGRDHHRDDGHDRGGPQQAVDPAEAVVVPPAHPAVAPAHADDDGRDGAEQGDVEPALDRLLQVDASVRLLRQQRPAEAVDDQSGAAEQDRDAEDAAHEEGIDAEPAGDAAGHAADPAVLGAHEPGPAHRVEEAVVAGRCGPGRRGRGDRLARPRRCRLFHATIVVRRHPPP